MEFRRSKFSKKVRKKKRLGEFRHYGFSLDVYCGPDPEGKIADLVVNILIKRGLFCAGGGDHKKYSFFVDGLKKSEDKDWVFDEIKKIEEVEDVIIYETVDVWHEDADQYFEKVYKIRDEYENKKTER